MKEGEGGGAVVVVVEERREMPKRLAQAAVRAMVVEWVLRRWPIWAMICS